MLTHVTDDTASHYIYRSCLLEKVLRKFVKQALNVLPLEKTLLSNVKVNTGNQHAVCASQGEMSRTLSDLWRPVIVRE